MLDMVYPALKQIEVVNPAVVLENVPNFKASGAGAMMGTTLRRMGYFLTEMVLNGLISARTWARTLLHGGVGLPRVRSTET